MKRLFFKISLGILLLFLGIQAWSGESDFKAGYEAFLKKNYRDAAPSLQKSALPMQHALKDYELWALGKTQVELGDFPSAMKNLEELIKQEPSSLWFQAAQVQVGRAYQAQGNFAKARGHLQPIFPNLPGDLKGEAAYYLGLGELGSGKKDQAIEYFKQAYLQYPTSMVDGEALVKLKELGITNFSPSDLLNRGDKLFAAKNYSKALATYETILALPMARVMKGESLYFLKRYGDAEIYLATQDPSIPAEVARRALLHLGMSQLRTDDEASALASFGQVQARYPGTPEGEEALYRMGMIEHQASRFAEAARHFQKLASGYPSGDFRDKGLWAAAWSFYRQSDWGQALKFLGDMEQGARDAPTKAKALYWQARILQKQGHKAKAGQIWTRTYQVSPYSYYGFMALRQLHGISDLKQIPSRPQEWKISPVPPLKSRKSGGEIHFKKALALYQIGLGAPSLAEVEAAVKEGDGSPDLLEAGRRSEAYYIPVLFGQKYWENFLPSFGSPTAAEEYRVFLLYPYAFRPLVESAAKEFSVPSYLVVALMRQESGFMPWIISSANAQGLMQLLPATAAARAKKIGMSGFDLTNPPDNIRLGTAELAAMLERFSGNWIHAFAAYNAGPGRAQKWSGEFGNLSPDEFIEEIPFAETNLYVKLVLRNYWTYKMLNSK